MRFITFGKKAARAMMEAESEARARARRNGEEKEGGYKQATRGGGRGLD